MLVKCGCSPTTSHPDCDIPEARSTTIANDAR
jgi:hypothetical protein